MTSIETIQREDAHPCNAIALLFYEMWTWIHSALTWNDLTQATLIGWLIVSRLSDHHLYDQDTPPWTPRT